jgi:hypothetical protein
MYVTRRASVESAFDQDATPVLQCEQQNVEGHDGDMPEAGWRAESGANAASAAATASPGDTPEPAGERAEMRW